MDVRDEFCLLSFAKENKVLHCMHAPALAYISRIMRLNGLMSYVKWWDEAAVGVGL